MRALALLALVLLAPVAFAGSTTGIGDGLGYVSCTDVRSTSGAAFTVTSADGDWDVFFNDEAATAFQQAGDESGVVPAGATAASVCLWGSKEPLAFGLPLPVVGSTFTYEEA